MLPKRRTMIFLHFFLISSVIAHFDPKSADTPSTAFKRDDTVYKPEGFNMRAHYVGRKTIVLSFNYSTEDPYDAYMFRIRFHEHPEYSSGYAVLDKKGENKLKMRKMVNAVYAACVVLFSTSQAHQHPPLSMTGMCVDFTIGQAPPIDDPGNETGLLVPLLLIFSFIMLLFVASMDFLHRQQEQRLLKQAKNKRNKVHMHKTNDSREAIVTITLGTNASFQNPSFISSNDTFSEFYTHEGGLSSVRSMNHLLEDKPWRATAAKTVSFDVE